ncbi:MAG: (d)CMP kinase [Bdellovibrionota bacterium]
MEKLKVITIDGPAGSGKSTVAKMTAAELGWIYVTTGAIYRTLALLLHEAGVNSDAINSHHIERYISFINERYRQESASGKVFIGEREVTQDIQSPIISKLSSVFAQDEYIRDKLLPIQRKIVCDTNGAVVDGRDMGTVIFPSAPLKIFLTASVEERAKRRYKELTLEGEKIEFEKLVKDINERDFRDSNRSTAPLKPAEDAIILDSTYTSQEEITVQILHLAVAKKLILSE